MNARFYVPDALATGESVALPDEEAVHASRVLRLGAGAAVRIFNGLGEEFDATIVDAARDKVTVTVGERREATPEPRLGVTLVQAVPKGDKMDEVVRDAVMLGVAVVQPIVSWRCETTLAALERGRRRERWQRIAVASAKQCGRAVVPPVRDPMGFERYLESLDGDARPLMFVEPGASGGTLSLRELPEHPPSDVSVLVGPEGGWSLPEVEAGATRCRLVTIGGRTFRADVAGIVVVSALFARWGEF